MDYLNTLFLVVGAFIFIPGLLTLLYGPLALLFELKRSRRKLDGEFQPAVSVVVPAFNEEKVIANCVESILAADYSNKEVLLVDDGSTDGTLEVMRRFEGAPGVVVLTQQNAGKAAALNNGLAHATGEFVLCVDADGMFRADTIRQMIEPFWDARVGAVCGNDSPINLNSLQTHLLSIMARVGTGFVRRALSEIDCLPIVAGNSGAFRRETLDKTGPFLDGFIGEDLELTWRVHRSGYKVKFQPRAVIYAEVPATVKSLWKQRVRWARGLLQTAYLHRSIMFRSRYGLFGWFLPLNYVRMVAVPLFQLVAIALMVLLAAIGQSPVPAGIVEMIIWVGLGVGALTAVFAIALDGAWLELKYLYVLPLWVPYSLLMSLVVLRAIILELRGGEAKWHKLDRSGVVSRNDVVR